MLCIKPEVADKIIELIQAKKVKIEDIYGLDGPKNSAGRRAMWEKHVDKDIAKFVNTAFEEAVFSEDKAAISRLLEKLQTKDASPIRRKTFLDKLKNLDERGLLDNAENTYADLVSDAIGITVTEQELEQVANRAKRIETAREVLRKKEMEHLNISDAKEAIKHVREAKLEYNTALTDMDKYLNELTPTNIIKVVTGSVFRGNMLLNVPSTVVNIISNTAQGIFKGLERRITAAKIAGVDPVYAKEWYKMAEEVYRKTGRDIAREYSQDIRRGEHMVHNEGPDITDVKGVGRKAAAGIRKVARGQAWLVYKYMLGYVDMLYAAAARADYASLSSARIAKKKVEWNQIPKSQEKAYAKRLLRESLSETAFDSGEMGADAAFVKTASIIDAESATWTDKTWTAEKATKFRNWVNEVTGSLQLGYWTIPFVKTGANVLQFGFDAAGLGAYKGIRLMPEAIEAWKNKSLPVRQRIAPMQEMSKMFARTGLGLAFSLLFVGLLDPDDFIGAYDVQSQKERDELGLKNGVYNAVRVGDKWISLDYFGPLAAPIVGIMYARKYGKGFIDGAFKYAQGAAQQTLQIPGLSDFDKIYGNWQDILTAGDLKEGSELAVRSAVNSLPSRVIPGIFGTVARMADTEYRKIDRKTLDEGFQRLIPGLREALPSKIDVTTGKAVQEEGAISTLLFGSRVKTANRSRLLTEISRLTKAGHGPAISDIERSSAKVQELKQQLDQKAYQSALKYFGREYGRKAISMLGSYEYRTATDEEKKQKLNYLRSQTREDMLKRYGYRPRKKGRKR
jgi:hypothetical protein